MTETNHELDEARSREIAQHIKSKARSPFHNAYKATLITEGATYVQGFLTVGKSPYRIVEHGWLEVDDRLVDPSLPHLGDPTPPLFYFPAQRLSVQQLKGAVEEAKEDYPEDDPLPIYGLPPYEYYGEMMLGGQAYLSAYQAAEAKYKDLRRGEAEKN